MAVERLYSTMGGTSPGEDREELVLGHEPVHADALALRAELLQTSEAAMALEGLGERHRIHLRGRRSLFGEHEHQLFAALLGLDNGHFTGPAAAPVPRNRVDVDNADATVRVCTPTSLLERANVIVQRVAHGVAIGSTPAMLKDGIAA